MDKETLAPAIGFGVLMFFFGLAIGSINQSFNVAQKIEGSYKVPALTVEQCTSIVTTAVLDFKDRNCKYIFEAFASGEHPDAEPFMLDLLGDCPDQDKTQEAVEAVYSKRKYTVPTY